MLSLSPGPIGSLVVSVKRPDQVQILKPSRVAEAGFVETDYANLGRSREVYKAGRRCEGTDLEVIHVLSGLDSRAAGARYNLS